MPLKRSSTETAYFREFGAARPSAPRPAPRRSGRPARHVRCGPIAERPTGASRPLPGRRSGERKVRFVLKHVKTARKWAVTGDENGPLLYYPVILVAKTVKTVIIIYIQTVCNCENGRTGGRVGGSHSRGRARSLFFSLRFAKSR